jgi:hypothetical protein
VPALPLMVIRLAILFLSLSSHIGFQRLIKAGNPLSP